MNMMMTNQAFLTKFTTNNSFVQFNESKNVTNSALRAVFDGAKKSVASHVEENKYEFNFNTIKNQYDHDEQKELAHLCIHAYNIVGYK